LLKTAKLDTVLKGKMEFVDYLKLDVQVSLLYQKVGVCLLWF
jgi:hypothetical protein